VAERLDFLPRSGGCREGLPTLAVLEKLETIATSLGFSAR
jgi:hypothetical protein